MTRNINDFLVSGEASNIVVNGNIGYASVSDPSFDNMFLRVENGITSLYRAPDQDVHWEDIDTTEFALTTSAQEVLSVTIDQEMTTDDGSFVVSGKVSNSRNQDQTMTIITKDDGVQVGIGTIDLLPEENGKLFAFSGGLSGNIASGSVITVEFYANQAGNLTLNGTAVATKLKLTKAQAAPVVMSAAVLDSFDWNTLPHSDPHEYGQLYIHDANNTIRVSQG